MINDDFRHREGEHGAGPNEASTKNEWGAFVAGVKNGEFDTAAQPDEATMTDTTVQELLEFQLLLNESSLGSPTARAGADLMLEQQLTDGNSDVTIDARVVESELLAAAHLSAAGDHDAARRSLLGVLAAAPTPKTWPLQTRAADQLDADDRLDRGAPRERDGATSGCRDDAQRLRWLSRAVQSEIKGAAELLEDFVAAYFGQLLSTSSMPDDAILNERSNCECRSFTDSFVLFAALGIDDALLSSVLSNWVGAPTADLVLQDRDLRHRLTRVLDHTYARVFSDAERSPKPSSPGSFPGLVVLLDGSTVLPDFDPHRPRASGLWLADQADTTVGRLWGEDDPLTRVHWACHGAHESGSTAYGPFVVLHNFDRMQPDGRLHVLNATFRTQNDLPRVDALYARAFRSIWACGGDRIPEDTAESSVSHDDGCTIDAQIYAGRRQQRSTESDALIRTLICGLWEPSQTEERMYELWAALFHCWLTSIPPALSTTHIDESTFRATFSRRMQFALPTKIDQGGGNSSGRTKSSKLARNRFTSSISDGWTRPVVSRSGGKLLLSNHGDPPSMKPRSGIVRQTFRFELVGKGQPVEGAQALGNGLHSRRARP